MKIINNKIYISKGETPTYTANVIDKETGAPLTISSGINNPLIQFIVRPSIYSREDDFVMKEDMLYDGKRFEQIKDYEEAFWNDDIPGESNILYRKGLDYKFYNSETEKWEPYSFEISFQFPYSDTSKMEPKIYKYEITLFGGSLKPTEELAYKETPINIDYKKPLLEATDFIVGGSLSE